MRTWRIWPPESRTASGPARRTRSTLTILRDPSSRLAYVYLSVSLCLCLRLCLSLSLSVSLSVYLSVSFQPSLLTCKDWSRGNIQDFHGQAGVVGSNLPDRLFKKSLSLICLSLSFFSLCLSLSLLCVCVSLSVSNLLLFISPKL